ncbi:MAG TPA: glycosyltransferase family 2 protein [Chitinophagales bacterium]|nr:glycosyltransferase family 2 protein [Chitinophagales bacterium]MCB9074608.1 glycosyltransferase family 2 protein [Chitinophagales bacterium]HMV03903.1 glycosyltransferase family 2 protein [Chitinophagales bacterium]HMZ95365.1 glycosyltransferase family 2 protein [Chitinophagales bacterium]HNC65297.1 glycosyltransferase family 2 protein [Chitinophagales bacterium]
MDISIIIINYNTFELTSKCIESLYKYNDSFSYEIILVDNASSECDTNLFLDKFPDINLVISEINLGFAGGNNLGIKQASGDYILLLNSDTELIENSILLCLNYMKNNKKIGVLSPKLIFPNGQHQAVAQRFPSMKYQLIELFRLQKLLPKKIAGKLLLGAFFDHNENAKVDWVWGAFFLFRKEILNLLPNQQLDDTYFMYFEDIQWCMDIKKLDYEIHYFAETKVIHKMGGSSGKKNEMMEKNRIIFFKKNYNIFERYFIKE